MREEDAERLLDDLRLLETMLDGKSTGISDARRTFVSALLCAMRGVKSTEPRLEHSLKALCFAVRGCYGDSHQRHLLVQVFDQVGLEDAQVRVRAALWSRAHEALAELKAEMDRCRRRSS